LRTMKLSISSEFPGMLHAIVIINSKLR